MSGLILALSTLGFIALLLAMQRHGRDWLGENLSPTVRTCLRSGGFGLQAGALVQAASAFGIAYGCVVWLGAMSLAAAIVVALNCNRSRLQLWAGSDRK